MPFQLGNTNNLGRPSKGGRKPDPARTQLKRLAKSAVPATARKAIFAALAEKAQDGDVAAANLLLAYLYGRPAQQDATEEIQAAIDAWKHKVAVIVSQAEPERRAEIIAQLDR